MEKITCPKSVFLECQRRFIPNVNLEDTLPEVLGAVDAFIDGLGKKKKIHKKNFALVSNFNTRKELKIFRAWIIEEFKKKERMVNK